MKKMLLLGVILINSAILSASSLDEAALALSKGEVTEESLKNNFSKSDFDLIMEKYKGMRLERAKKETEKQKVNELLKKRNMELEQEIKKIKSESSSNKNKNTKITLDQVIKNTYRGIYGDNPLRAKKLQELGFNAEEIKKIQKAVNDLVEKEKEKNKEQ